jgi:SPRY domain-containing SOCS box protein 3
MVLCETRRDFVNLQDRCRAVITKSIKNRDSLEMLKLPLRITNYLSEAFNDPATPLTPVDNFYDLYMV